MTPLISEEPHKRSWIFPRYVELRIARAMASSGLCAAGARESLEGVLAGSVLD